MAELFVPLLPAGLKQPAVPAASASLKVQPRPATNDSFQPLVLGNAPTNADLPSLCNQANGVPQVTLQRDGDRVTRIRVQCSCGQVAELECVY